MANASSIVCVKDIILADAQAKYIVVSAPGKRTKADVKVTDLLVQCYNEKTAAAKVAVLKKVRERFNNIIKDLSIDVSFDGEFDALERSALDVSYDFLVSRGEYFTARLLAAYLGYAFVDAAEFVRFCGKSFDAETTDKLGKEALLPHTGGVVIPGFYGTDNAGEVVAFSRGGSDISGAIVARAVGAEVYENWTDVDGFMVCDPRVVENPRIIDMLTYKELRELSYMGASVLHPESVFPVRTCNIPINIRNTFSPSVPGTFIVPTKYFKKGQYKRECRIITGIAGQKDFTGIFIEKQMMNGEVGFIKALMDILYEYGISLEHMPTGIDTVTLVIDSHGIPEKTLADAVEKIKRSCRPDDIEVQNGIALIAVVGHGMASIKGTASRVCGALSSADINIRMIDQGSSELNIIVAVDNADYEKAVCSLYNEFETD